MKYSRFDEAAGVYDVFEDDKQHALNSDLPVPSLPPPDQGIGVASKFAGRPLPRGARLVGTSWRPVGVIVVSKGVSGGLGSVGEQIKSHPVLFAAGAGLLMFAAFKVYVNEMAKWGERY
jgi:hypothetical protein